MMKDLQEYIKESLLDDLDDLENDSDNMVKASKSLGKKYKVQWVAVEGIDDLLNNLNKDKLNSLNTLYKEDFKITDKYQDPLPSNTPTEDVRKLVQSIMDLSAVGNWKNALNKHLKECLKCLFSIDYMPLKGSLAIRIRLRGLYNGIFINCIKR